MNCLRQPAVLLCLTFICSPANAEGLIIWRPVKLSDQSYKTSMGFTLPMTWEPSAGLDLGISAVKGKVLPPDSQQAMLWASLRRSDKGFAETVETKADMRVSTLQGSAALMLSRSRTWIFSDSLDIASTKSVSLDYSGEQQTGAMIAAQSLTFTQPWTKTSLTAGANFSDYDQSLSSSLSLNQAITPNLNLNANVANPFSTDRSGSVRVDYNIRW